MAGMRFLLPYGLGPYPGWTDCCVKAVLRVAKLVRPSPRAIDSGVDSRLVEADDARTLLFAGALTATRLLLSAGARCRIRESTRW